MKITLSLFQLRTLNVILSNYLNQNRPTYDSTITMVLMHEVLMQLYKKNTNATARIVLSPLARKNASYKLSIAEVEALYWLLGHKMEGVYPTLQQLSDELGRNKLLTTRKLTEA